jgi:glycine cleavage system T protein
MPEQSPLHDLTSQAGAVFAERDGYTMPAHYGDALAEYRHARQASVIFDVSSRGKVEVAGSEAGMFLHNLSTNDIKELSIGAGCEAFFATATAKAIDHVLIYHVVLHDGRDAFWIDVKAGRSEKLIQHLDRHLISEQVEFADRTREFAQIHLAGPNAKDILEKALLDEVPPLEPLQHMIRTFGANSHSHIRRHDPLALHGYDIVCLNALAANVWGLLVRAGAKPAGLDAYELLRVEAGTPVYGVDIDENRFIVEVGRTATAISYNKGCYLGQEPVVMARDRGQVQRTFLGLKLTGNSPVPPGSKLFRDGKEVGVTASSIVSPALGMPIALAYVKRGSQEPGTVVEVEAGSQRIAAEVTRLPFRI